MHNTLTLFYQIPCETEQGLLLLKQLKLFLNAYYSCRWLVVEQITIS